MHTTCVLAYGGLGFNAFGARSIGCGFVEAARHTSPRFMLKGSANLSAASGFRGFPGQPPQGPALIHRSRKLNARRGDRTQHRTIKHVAPD